VLRAARFGLAFPLDEKATQHEQIHPSPEKTIQRFPGPTNYRFVLIERGVEHERNRGQRIEVGNQLMVERVGFVMDGL
jgi:hypothetical protein